MMRLEESIIKEKQRYLDFAEMNKEKHIYIFGAGKQAVPIGELFKTSGIRIDGFCVSNKSNNKKEINQLPVCQIDEIPYKNAETAFVFGVRAQLNEEIETILKKYGYTNFLYATDLIRYLGSYGYSFYTSPMLEITTKLGCAVIADIARRNFILKNICARAMERESFHLKILKYVLINFQKIHSLNLRDLQNLSLIKSV